MKAFEELVECFELPKKHFLPLVVSDLESDIIHSIVNQLFPGIFDAVSKETKSQTQNLVHILF